MVLPEISYPTDWTQHLKYVLSLCSYSHSFFFNLVNFGRYVYTGYRWVVIIIEFLVILPLQVVGGILKPQVSRLEVKSVLHYLYLQLLVKTSSLCMLNLVDGEFHAHHQFAVEKRP